MYLKLFHFFLFHFLAETIEEISHLRDKGIYIDINQPQEGGLGYIRGSVHIGRGPFFFAEKHFLLEKEKNRFSFYFSSISWWHIPNRIICRYSTLLDFTSIEYCFYHIICMFSLKFKSFVLCKIKHKSTLNIYTHTNIITHASIFYSHNTIHKSNYHLGLSCTECDIH